MVFLTLFSLVLVLSIYYVTMPNEIFDKELENKAKDNTVVNTDESTLVAALKVEDDTEVMNQINKLKREKLTDNSITTEEKNTVFEELKLLNNRASKRRNTRSKKIKEVCNCENFVKIDGDNVRVILDSSDNSVSTANKIMRLVQNEFDDKMYISVKI
ncbi:MAG: hypothetical protein L6V91_06015 [Bacilli bacterium]|nr:MAG: hypothetical protein L6V91_06015 [Bacilli bacterium]